jgi:hypothetical protein
LCRDRTLSSFVCREKLTTIGSANLSDFFSSPYHTVSYRNVPYGTIPYRTIPYCNRQSIVLKNSAKATENAMLKKGIKCIFGTLRFTPNCVFNTNSVYMVHYFSERKTVCCGTVRYGTVRYGTVR